MMVKAKNHTLPKLAFVADQTEEAQKAYKALQKIYDTEPVEHADALVVLGGDGFMLQTLHDYMEQPIPFYGMNCGSVGFLLNEFRLENLLERIQNAECVHLHPLEMKALTRDHQIHHAKAINEVSWWRQSRQAAKIQILTDHKEKLPELVCDGVLVATPAGSTAYNLSAHGPILPMGANLLALTPISAFRPRRWRGALLPYSTHVTLKNLDPDKRPITAAADFTEVRDVIQTEVYENRKITLKLLFDPEHNLEERILNEQFIS